MLTEKMRYQQDIGSHGPRTKQPVQWVTENARGKFYTSEKCLLKNPLPM